MKSKTNIVYVSYAKQLEANAIRIATNKKIPVTVGDKATTMDIGGYYVIHGRDLKAFIEKMK